MHFLLCLNVTLIAELIQLSCDEHHGTETNYQIPGTNHKVGACSPAPRECYNVGFITSP